MSDGPLDSGPVAAQADAALAALTDALAPGTVLGIYLYGSAVEGDLRPDSDLDLFGVLSRRLTAAERAALVAGLVPVSWRAERSSDWAVATRWSRGSVRHRGDPTGANHAYLSLTGAYSRTRIDPAAIEGIPAALGQVPANVSRHRR